MTDFHKNIFKGSDRYSVRTDLKFAETDVKFLEKGFEADFILSGNLDSYFLLNFTQLFAILTQIFDAEGKNMFIFSCRCLYHSKVVANSKFLF